MLAAANFAYPDDMIVRALERISGDHNEDMDGLAQFLALEIIESSAGNPANDMLDHAIGALHRAVEEVAQVRDFLSRLHNEDHLLHYDLPPGISEAAGRAARVVIAYAMEIQEDGTGGCTPWYSPEQWKERGEEFGCDSELIVCHDGGDLSYLFNAHKGNPEMVREMYKRLRDQGFEPDPKTCWYTAIYERRDDPPASDDAAASAG